MRHELLTQHAPFCIGAMAKKGTLSQHFMTQVVPPLGWGIQWLLSGCGMEWHPLIGGWGCDLSMC